MGLRHKSIRLRVLLLIIIPLLSLLGVYAYATTTTTETAVSLLHGSQVNNVSVQPAANIMKAIALERNDAVTYIVAPTPKTQSALAKAQATTNGTVAAYLAVLKSGALAKAGASALDLNLSVELQQQVNTLPGLRDKISSRSITPQDAVNAYSSIVLAGYQFMQQSILKTNIDQAIVTTAQQQINLFLAEELVLQESDLYTGALYQGQFTPAERAEFAQLVGQERYLTSTAVPQLDAVSHANYVKYMTPKVLGAVTSAENLLLSRNLPHNLPPVPPTVWAGAITPYANQMTTMLNVDTTAIVGQVQSDARSTLLTIFVSAALGLLAIIISILVSIIVGRGLIGQLKELRQSALELAHDRLPSVIRRLRDGESVDVASEAPAIEAPEGVRKQASDEIDQVQQAFNAVRRVAVSAAVDEANLRRGISDVFRNLARRSQVLLHRQLRLLDGMERRASEPEELEDLFRIDHLTTRMRRHAEGLIILSGEPAGRTWRHPVPLMDVLRAAVAEVEDYTRIRVEARTRAALSGTAVADVIHLIAELAENATVFSPPNTPVKITGDVVGRGFAIEIEDRGLGITEERLAEINRNLEDPPAFDLSGSDRLGLFIAGRLAKRHDIKITLRPSVYGGTQAIVIIPISLVVDEDAYENVPAIGGEGRGLSLGGRHAALTDSGPDGPPSAVSAVSAPSPSGNGALAGGAGPMAGNGAGGNGNGHGNGNSVWSREPSPSGQPPADPSFWNSPPAAAPTAAPTGRLSGGQPPSYSEPRPAQYSGLPNNPQADWAELATGPQPTSRGPEPTPSYGDSGGYGDNTGVDDFGLPTRVRQANLAPQLREPTRPDLGEARLPTPEAARNTMAALQRGWELGRTSDGPATDTGIPPATEND